MAKFCNQCGAPLIPGQPHVCPAAQSAPQEPAPAGASSGFGLLFLSSTGQNTCQTLKQRFAPDAPPCFVGLYHTILLLVWFASLSSKL